MGVIRAQPARINDWAAKPVGAAWRAFDLLKRGNFYQSN